MSVCLSDLCLSVRVFIWPVFKCPCLSVACLSVACLNVGTPKWISNSKKTTNNRFTLKLRLVGTELYIINNWIIKQMSFDNDSFPNSDNGAKFQLMIEFLTVTVISIIIMQ